MINSKDYYFPKVVYHNDMSISNSINSHMLANIQEVLIMYLFLSQRHQRSVGKVAERVSDMGPN